MEKNVITLMFITLVSSAISKVEAKDINEEISNPYETVVYFANQTKLYANAENAKIAAENDYSYAVSFIKEQLSIDDLDYSDINILNAIYGSISEDIKNPELLDQLWKLAAFADIYSNSFNQPSLETYSIVPSEPGDGSAAAAYAFKYALNYNSKYTSFANNGGDCANFMSQSLVAGGIPTNSKWKAYTTYWINADKFTNLFDGTNEHNIGWSGSKGNSSGVLLGDIIAFDYANDGDYDHVVMVTNKGINASNNKTVLYYSGHTNDRSNYNFTAMLNTSSQDQQAYIKSFTPQ